MMTRSSFSDREHRSLYRRFAEIPAGSAQVRGESARRRWSKSGLSLALAAVYHRGASDWRSDGKNSTAGDSTERLFIFLIRNSQGLRKQRFEMEQPFATSRWWNCGNDTRVCTGSDAEPTA